MDVGSLAIGGIALIPLILGLVQLLKKFGIGGNMLMYIAIGLGAFFGLLFKLYELFPSTHIVIEVLVFVIGFALFAAAATGLFDLGTAWTNNIKSTPVINITQTPVTKPYEPSEMTQALNQPAQSTLHPVE